MRNAKLTIHMDIKIDESKQQESPSVLKRSLGIILGLFYGALFVQLFAFTLALTPFKIVGSIVLWYNKPLFLVFEGICGALGWFYGADFNDWLKVKIIEWTPAILWRWRR